MSPLADSCGLVLPVGDAQGLENAQGTECARSMGAARSMQVAQTLEMQQWNRRAAAAAGVQLNREVARPR